MSRFLHGGRSILVLATLSTALALVLGVAIGLVAAYNRGRLDDVLMRIMDINLAFPQLLLALVALTAIGPEAVADRADRRVHHHPAYRPHHAWRRRARGRTRLRRRRRGARRIALHESCGASCCRTSSGPLLVEANLRLTYSIGIIASLGFLGFSTRVNAADWGLMVQREPRCAQRAAVGHRAAGARHRDAHHRHRPDRATASAEHAAGIDRAKGDA